MTISEIATLFGIKETEKSMKNKAKAKDILAKILKCHKCGDNMKWIEGTNVCVCEKCTYTVGKDEHKQTFSVSKNIPERSRRFLENNYSLLFEEDKEKEEV